MKNIFLFAILSSFYACKSNEMLTPNRPPNSFSVTATLKSDGSTIVLNWTKATDPDADVVTYTVVLKDTLVKNISDTTFTIANLGFNYSQTGKIIAKDAKGLTTEASFIATTEFTNFVRIPDALFEKCLVNINIDKDGIVDGKMNRDDAKGIKEINCQGSGINSLVGIEAFVDLERLSIGITAPSSSYLPSLDISKNTKLEYLWIAGGSLKELDISKNINLKSITLLYIFIPVLDLSKNTKLKYMELYSTGLESLNFSNNPDFEHLSCTYNPSLKKIDVSKNINLRHLSCSVTNIKVLDVSNNINLASLECMHTQIVNLDVSKNINLEYLSCGANQIANLDVSKNINLATLACSELTNLNISKNINLVNLWYSGKQLTNLDVSKNLKLKKLVCTGTSLTDLNVEKNRLLEILLCSDNNLESLNLSKNTELIELSCRKNERLKTICISNTSKILNIDKDFDMTLKVC